jgi:hypothetical protein
MKPSSFVALAIALAVTLCAVILSMAFLNPPRKVLVLMGTNGTARVWGISLKNQHVRRGAFWALGKLKDTETVLMMPGQWSNYTNVQPQIRLVAKEMSAAGLIPRKQLPQLEPLVLKPKEPPRPKDPNRPLILLPETNHP